MNRIIALVLFSIASLSAAAQNTAVIAGKFSNLASASFGLRTSVYQLGMQPATITQGKADANGGIQINLNLPSSVPVVLTVNNFDVSVFVNRGDSVFITADGNKFYETLSFSGKGAEANNFLAALFLKFDKPDMDEALKIQAADKTDAIGGYVKLPHAIKYKTMMQDDFFKYADKLSADKQKFFKEKINQAYSFEFKNWMQAEIKYEGINMKSNYAGIHTMLNPVETNANFNTKFESIFNIINLNDSNAIFSEHYIKYLESYFGMKASEPVKAGGSQPTMKQTLEQGYQTKKKELKGTLRDYMLARHISSCQTILKSDTAFCNQLINDYKTINIDKNFLNVLMAANAPKQTQQAPAGPKAGDKAPEFTVLGADGSPVKLSDYKGKVVYLDVWASWCGPCKREIPYAREMEEKLKGEDIVFLCVSIDRDSSSWRRILMEQNPVGIHAIDLDPANNVSKNYGVATIPRYIIIDRNGIIVDPNAKRPSGGVADDLLQYNKK